MNKKESLIHDMTQGPLLRQLIYFSLPIIAGNILQSMYTVIDMLIVGRWTGSNGLSAVGIGGVLQNLLMMTGMSMGFGGQILLSQLVGAHRKKQIGETIGTFFSIFAIMAVILGIAGALLADWQLKLLNTPALVYTHTKGYYLVCCAGLIFIYGYNAVGAVLRGLGESKLPTVFILIASVINIGLDLLFVAVFNMGVEGAAVATVIAQGSAFVISIGYLYRHRKAFEFDFKPRSLMIHAGALKAIVKLSGPLMIYGLLLSLSTMFINSNVNTYGIAASAADGVGGKFFMIATAITMGIYNGAAAIVGQCFGAGKSERIKSVFRMTVLLSIAFWTLLAVILLIFPRQIFGIFSQDPAVLDMARPYFTIALLLYLGMAFATGPYALMEGVGNTNLEMWAGIVENLLIKVAVSMLLSRVIGLYGYWMGCSVAAFTTPAIGFAYYFSKKWEKRGLAMESESKDAVNIAK